MSNINIPPPKLQIDFSFALGQIRNMYLQDALSRTVGEVNLKILDEQLAGFVPQDRLKELAKHGLRGELLYPVPCILEANPYLLGYYRLLLGFSQKEFYSSEFGLTPFKMMESGGLISKNASSQIKDLCKSLIQSASTLVHGIGADRLSKEFIDDLTLLTVGPQLRGGANVKKGEICIVEVFQAIHNIVRKDTVKSNSKKIEIINAARRKVLIEFAADPDLVIREEMSEGNFRNIIAVEVKGGTDFSNIHNRIGEAEKSHQKAKAKDYFECWTVVNVDRIDMAMAKKESPTTNKFYRLSDLKSGKGEEYQDFKERIVSLTGIINRKRK